jgi:hypothetical protein
LTIGIYPARRESKNMPNEEKEVKIAEIFLRTFDEKSPLDYDILDSMFKESKIISDYTEY